MTFIVGQGCINCKHTDCVEVCPVDCFYEGENTLVINPDECIDCGLCEPECPIEAIYAEDEVPADQIEFIEINEKYSKIWPNITEAKDPMPDHEEGKEKTNKIDALINNVGIAGPTGTLEKLKSKDWENTLKVNVISHFYFSKYSIPMLKKNKGGAIINLSSTAGIFGFPLRSPYCASKWAVVGITKTLAMELGKFKIRVNAICPGTIKGDRMGRVIRDKSKFLNVSKKLIEKEFVSMTSMNTWVYEEDIGRICSFLISNDAPRISGQVIAVDGNTLRMH